MVEPLEPNHCGLLAQRGACYPIQRVFTKDLDFYFLSFLKIKKFFIL